MASPIIISQLCNSHGSLSSRKAHAAFFPSRANFAAVGTNNCIQDCDSYRRRRLQLLQVPGPYASEMRFRRVRARERRERKGEKESRRRKGRSAAREAHGGEGEGKERYKTVESTRVLALRRQARGNLRCAANVSLPGSAHTGSYRISNELPAMPAERKKEKERRKRENSRARLSVAEDS